MEDALGGWGGVGFIPLSHLTGLGVHVTEEKTKNKSTFRPRRLFTISEANGGSDSGALRLKTRAAASDCSPSKHNDVEEDA